MFLMAQNFKSSCKQKGVIPVLNSDKIKWYWSRHYNEIMKIWKNKIEKGQCL